VSQEEFDKAKAGGVDLKRTIVGYDGIAVIVHPSNPISELTRDQLSDIFTGKIVNWQELGGRISRSFSCRAKGIQARMSFSLSMSCAAGMPKAPRSLRKWL